MILQVPRPNPWLDEELIKKGLLWSSLYDVSRMDADDGVVCLLIGLGPQSKDSPEKLRKCL